MNEAQRRALGAAVRLALGAVALPACGGVVAQDPAPSPRPSSAEGSPVASASASAADAGGPAESGGPADAAGPGCRARLAAAFPDGGGEWWAPTGTPLADPELARCCEALAKEDLEAARRAGCCGVEFPDRVGACTPWGPPTPPALVDEGPRHAGAVALDLHAQAAPIAGGLGLDVPAHLAPRVQATWLGRMTNEHGSARVFEGLAEALEAAGLDPADVRACRVFADEERHHGVLCGAVAVAAGGRAVAPALPSSALPRHPDASPLEALARNLLSISCLSETVAVALVGAEREEMPSGRLRELLTRIWADEVGHARFGWRLLAALVPRLDARARRGLGRYLSVAFAHLEEHELEHLPLAAVRSPGGAALGLCSGAEARALFYATVEAAIVPGLERLGLPARSAWASRRRARARPIRPAGRSTRRSGRAARGSRSHAARPA